MKPRVLVIGNARMDLILPMGRLPERGGFVAEPDRSFLYRPGGSGAAVAVALSRLGVDAVLLSRLGNDSSGARLRRLYERENVDVRFTEMDQSVQTGLCTVLTEDGAEPRRIKYAGAAACLNREQVESAATCLPDAVYLGLSAPGEALVAGAALAREKGIPLFADGTAPEGFDVKALGAVEVFMPGEEETERLTGIRPGDADSCLRASVKLGSMMDARFIVLKLGRRGCFAYDGKFYHMIRWPAEHIRDSERSPDVFSACLIAAHMDGDGIDDACRFAVSGASYAANRGDGHGAYGNIPRRADLAKWAEDCRP